MKNTLVVNFLGGPGIGKSTLSAGVFNILKQTGINCELVTEYAKDLVWENRINTFKDQIYLFAKQNHRLFNLIGKVDVILNDGCLLGTIIYDQEKRKSLAELVFNEYKKMNNFNILLNRNKKFVNVGRIHNEQESKKIDNLIEDLLKLWNLNYLKTNDINLISDKILKIIK